MGYIVTPVKALRLMQESEKHDGHPCTKHIGLSNEQLMQRLYKGDGARNNGIQYISTFMNESEAARAACQTFKNISGGVYKALDDGGNRASFNDVRVDEAFKVRFALGSGVKVYYVNHMTLALFRHPGQADDTFYVKTFYPRPPNELREEPKKGNI